MLYQVLAEALSTHMCPASHRSNHEINLLLKDNAAVGFCEDGLKSWMEGIDA